MMPCPALNEGKIPTMERSRRARRDGDYGSSVAGKDGTFGEPSLQLDAMARIAGRVPGDTVRHRAPLLPRPDHFEMFNPALASLRRLGTFPSHWPLFPTASCLRRIRFLQPAATRALRGMSWGWSAYERDVPPAHRLHCGKRLVFGGRAPPHLRGKCRPRVRPPWRSTRSSLRARQHNP